jgi:hypothetical protein
LREAFAIIDKGLEITDKAVKEWPRRRSLQTHRTNCFLLWFSERVCQVMFRLRGRPAFTTTTSRKSRAQLNLKTPVSRLSDALLSQL